MVGVSTPAWASHLSVSINFDDEFLPFHAEYRKTVFIVYPEDTPIHDQISGQYWQIIGSADSSDPGVQDLMDQINQKIFDSKSQVQVSDLEVSYTIHLKSFDNHISNDYTVLSMQVNKSAITGILWLYINRLHRGSGGNDIQLSCHEEFPKDIGWHWPERV